MKKFLTAGFCLFILVSCSRKTIPVNSSSETSADSITAATVSQDILIITDGFGRLITPEKSLPANASIMYNSLQLSKGFTAQQRANLLARYKTVPPRVLFVPQQLASGSLKGTYYVYKKKFWYWKKPDSLFYLDEKYYL